MILHMRANCARVELVVTDAPISRYPDYFTSTASVRLKVRADSAGSTIFLLPVNAAPAVPAPPPASAPMAAPLPPPARAPINAPAPAPPPINSASRLPLPPIVLPAELVASG